MHVRFPWEIPYTAQPVVEDPPIQALHEKDLLFRYDVEDDVDGSYYPDGVYWRYANSFSKRIVVEHHKVAEVMTIVRSGSRWLGFTVGHASITGPVYDYEPLLGVANNAFSNARVDVKRKSTGEIVVSLVLPAGV